jgi:two-component system, OmpR family, sensor histidine kinase ChvG
MAQAIVSLPDPDLGDAKRSPSLRWALGTSLTRRILAVNGLGLLAIAALIFYRESPLYTALFVLAAVGFSAYLSLSLGGAIVFPLRQLVREAVRVRISRAPMVIAPDIAERSDEIGLLARALDTMSFALQQRLKASENFAADVAHELKNPLASLRSAVDGLELVQATQHRAQLIGIIRDDVRRLDKLISDIAEISRLDAQLAGSPSALHDICALARTCVAQANMRVPSTAVRFHAPQAPQMMMGVAAQLESVFHNLIDNACSFSPAPDSVEVGLERQENHVLLWVEDAGPGIPEAERERIFERFQTYRPQAKSKHSGLGLAIVKTIIEAHGGTVQATTRQDGAEGARFEIRLPPA